MPPAYWKKLVLAEGAKYRVLAMTCALEQLFPRRCVRSGQVLPIVRVIAEISNVGIRIECRAGDGSNPAVAGGTIERHDVARIVEYRPQDKNRITVPGVVEVEAKTISARALGTFQGQLQKAGQFF